MELSIPTNSSKLSVKMTIQKKTIRDKIIFLDSCILLNCEGIVFKDKIRQVLRDLTDQSNKLLISEYSRFEVMKNARFQDNFKYFDKLLDFLGNIPISKESLISASALTRLYGRNKKTINFGDYIIGGTVVATKESLLLTSNNKDFCKPYWKTVEKNYVLYELEDAYNVLNIHLIEPDREKIKKEYLEDRNKKYCTNNKN